MSGAPAETVEAAGGQVSWIRRPDGVSLRAARFPGGSRGRCLFLSGYTEFIEKHLESVGELTARGYEVATFDWRGQGLSARALADRHKGHIDRMETHLDDLDAVLAATGGFATAPLTVVAHSMGAHLALRFCQARPGQVDRAVLVAPMLGIGRPGLPAGVARLLVEMLCRTPLVDGYVFGGAGYGPRRQRFEGNVLTNDRDRFEQLHRLLAGNPDLALGDPTFAWVRAALRSIGTVMAPGALEAVRVPLLIALAGQETVVSNAAIEAAAARLPDACLVRFPDAKHEILRERPAVRRAFWSALDAFIADTGG